jgi:hypothetical protein
MSRDGTVLGVAGDVTPRHEFTLRDLNYSDHVNEKKSVASARDLRRGPLLTPRGL